MAALQDGAAIWVPSAGAHILAHIRMDGEESIRLPAPPAKLDYHDWFGGTIHMC